MQSFGFFPLSLRDTVPSNFGISIFPSCSPSLNPSLCPSLSSVSRRQSQLSALRLQVLQVPSFDPCLPAFLSSSSYVKFLIPHSSVRLPASLPRLLARSLAKARAGWRSEASSPSLALSVNPFCLLKTFKLPSVCSLPWSCSCSCSLADTFKFSMLIMWMMSQAPNIFVFSGCYLHFKILRLALSPTHMLSLLPPGPAPSWWMWTSLCQWRVPTRRSFSWVFTRDQRAITREALKTRYKNRRVGPRALANQRTMASSPHFDVNLPSSLSLSPEPSLPPSFPLSLFPSLPSFVPLHLFVPLLVLP